MQRKPTKEEIQKRNTNRKEELLRAAMKKGVVDAAAKYLSAIYLLHSHSAVIYADLEELLQENGLELGRVKWDGKMLNKAFDKYFQTLSQQIHTDQTQNWANDLAHFGDMFNKFAGLTQLEQKEGGKG